MRRLTEVAQSAQSTPKSTYWDVRKHVEMGRVNADFGFEYGKDQCKSLRIESMGRAPSIITTRRCGEGLHLDEDGT